MKKALIFISLLLLGLPAYSQPKSKPAKPSPKPVSSKAPAFEMPKLNSCYSSALKESPMLGGVRLGMLYAAVSSKFKLEPASVENAKPDEKYWLTRTDSGVLQMTFFEDVLREIRSDYMANEQFADADEFATSVSKKLGLEDKWSDYETSPRHYKELSRINEARMSNNRKQLDLIGEDSKKDELERLKIEEESLDKERERFIRKISPIRYKSCSRFDVYAELVDGGLGIITLSVTER